MVGRPPRSIRYPCSPRLRCVQDRDLGDRDAGRERSDGLRRRARILQRLGIRSTEIALVGGLAVLENEHAREPREFPFALGLAESLVQSPRLDGRGESRNAGDAERQRPTVSAEQGHLVPTRCSAEHFETGRAQPTSPRRANHRATTGAARQPQPIAAYAATHAAVLAAPPAASSAAPKITGPSMPPPKPASE